MMLPFRQSLIMVTMLRPLVLAAILANLVLIVSCKGMTSSSASSASSSTLSTMNGGSASSSASSSSSSTIDTEEKPETEPEEECPVNEKSTNCIQTICGGESCARKGKPPMSCPAIFKDSCTRGCICIENYLRSQNGTCIPEDECDSEPICGDGEVLVNCPRDCSSQYCPTSKDEEVPPCVILDDCPPPQCRCRDNYLRSESGACIPADSCPEPVCDKGEVLVNCPRDCSSQYCPTSKDEYVPPCEVLDDCPPPQCRCRYNYLRSDNGTCIPSDSCPQVCGTNEMFSSCIQSVCRALNCTQKGQLLSCPYIPEDSCETGCICEVGYLRSENGTCVPEDNCDTEPICSDEEVRVNCPSHCSSDFCPTSDEDDGPCIFMDDCPPPECKCRINYRRSDNGTCIPTRNCPPYECEKPNEEYNSCPPFCSDSCNVATPTGECHIFGKIGILLICNPKCRCMKGYWRNDDGLCVPYAECPGICSANETYSNCTQSLCRIQNCTQQQLDIECLDSSDDSCKPGCVCDEGFLRADNGTCVPDNECETELICSDEEVLDNCPSDCLSDYCPTSDNDDDYASCTVMDDCPPPECKCRFNYRRSDNGTCIPASSCPPYDCDDNEEYDSCPPLCSDSCSEATPSGDCPYFYGRIGIVVPCNPKCRCMKGYWRNDNGSCVPYAECPGICSTNEIYSNCTQSICRIQNCTQQETDIECLDISDDSCQAGCVCDDGFLRADNGTCIPDYECHSEICASPNEEFSSCIQAICRAQNCSQQGTTFECADVDEDSCESGCICKVGFLRADNGTCVHENDCSSVMCMDPNEELSSCIQAVCRAKTCADNGTLTCDTIEEGYCEAGCLCKVGYLRNDNGTCIPEGDCNQVICDDPNEESSSCIQAVCRSLNCSQREDPWECPAVPEGSCQSGCVCAVGFLRSENGTCVPEDECDDQCTGPNEQYTDCKSTCRPDTCMSLVSKFAYCDEEDSCVPGCVCESGYLRRTATEPCMPIYYCF